MLEIFFILIGKVSYLKYLQSELKSTLFDKVLTFYLAEEDLNCLYHIETLFFQQKGFENSAVKKVNEIIFWGDLHLLKIHNPRNA